MVEQQLTVFISYELPELEAYMLAACQAVLQLGMRPVAVSEFSITSHATIETHKKKIEEADIFVGIYTRDDNRSPEPSETETLLQGRTIAEMEYYWAREKGLVQFIFIVTAEEKGQQDSPGLTMLNATLLQTINAAIKARKLNAFKSELMKGSHQEIQDVEGCIALVAEVLAHWQQNKMLPEFVRQRRIITILLIVLSALNLAVSLDFGWRILRAGENVGILIANIAMAIASLAPLVSYSLKFIKFSPPKSIRRWLPVVALGLALIVLTIIYQSTLRTLAQNQFQLAVGSSNIANAQQALNAASVLGGVDVSSSLSQTLSDSLDEPAREPFDAQALLLAELVRTENAGESHLITRIQSHLANALKEQSLDLVVRNATILAIVSPKDAAVAADNYNDEAVEYLQAQQLSRARIYLEAVRAIDKRLPEARPKEKRSVTLQNLGDILVRDDSRSENIDLAEEAYRDAIAIDEDNIEARQAIIALLIEQGQADSLDEAIDMAQAGARVLPSSCEVVPLSNDEQSWQCYQFLVLEGLARLGRGDAPSDLLSIAQRAVRIALDLQIPFSADAYYLYSIAKQDTSRAVLCAIIRNQNTSIQRHEDMAQYANELLSSRQEHCRPPIEPVTLTS